MGTTDYILAEGPQGLEKVLTDLLKRSKNDQDFASQNHYILYELSQQKSLIKVDMSMFPYKFWYYDLLGRPATGVVKETVARFLWEKCGERERYTQENLNQESGS